MCLLIGRHVTSHKKKKKIQMLRFCLRRINVVFIKRKSSEKRCSARLFASTCVLMSNAHLRIIAKRERERWWCR